MGDRLRSIDSKKVAALAESIAAIGLQQPISVWSPDYDTLDLVAGWHRVEAVKKLGWEEIDCVFVDMDFLTRQLWEIDENLMRAELGPGEVAQHTARRAEVVRQKVELLKLSKTKPDRSQNANKGQGEFVEETAKATGKSRSTVRRDKERGEKIPVDVIGKITGTGLDKGTYLDKLKKLSHDEQRVKVDRDLREIELKEIERSKKEALELEGWKPRNIKREFKKDHERVATRMETLGLTDEDFVQVDKWSKSLKLTSEKDKWENQALDLHEKGEPLKVALRQTKGVHNIELARVKEEQDKREAERERHYAEQEEHEWKTRDPLEHFAEYLLDELIINQHPSCYPVLIRHLNNSKHLALLKAVEKMKAEWDAEAA
ncbi:MAG: ParB N-terminal domain-containing protein [Alphaproteobacteria bacterium]|nr:ParB N-terminal domain-containing protein [Alphaproteobacteria bacterium]